MPSPQTLPVSSGEGDPQDDNPCSLGESGLGLGLSRLAHDSFCPVTV